MAQGRPTGHRIIEKDEMVAFRANDSDTLRRVLGKSISYASMFSAGLSSEDLDDVVSGAIIDVLPLINGNGSVQAINTELKRALERRRKRCQRYQAPQAEWVEPPQENDPAVQLIFRIRILRLVAGIEPAMQASMARLSERDRAILIYYYGLGEFLETSGEKPSFPSKEAETKARQRARSRFSQQLEKELLSLKGGAELNSEVLNDALQVVRGGKLQELVQSEGSS